MSYSLLIGIHIQKLTLYKTFLEKYRYCNITIKSAKKYIIFGENENFFKIYNPGMLFLILYYKD